MSIELVMSSSHLILYRPLFLLPSIFPSIRVFSNESVLSIRWPKYQNFSFNISLSKEYSGLISFRMNRLDLLAVQGPLKSLLQHHISEISVLWCSSFFIVQHSHPYMTTGKTRALTRQTLVGKVMSLLFNMLSRLVLTFLPRSKHLLISWLQSPSAVILEPTKKKKKSACFFFFNLLYTGRCFVKNYCQIPQHAFRSPGPRHQQNGGLQFLFQTYTPDIQELTYVSHCQEVVHKTFTNGLQTPIQNK